MEVLHARCAGLDVHKDTVVACVRVREGGAIRREVRTFGTVTAALCALSDWLTSEHVTHVAMEATGVYWKPVWHVLEDAFELVLANAKHIKNVPGRKTDVKDAEWIAELLAHGLIRGSFVPDRPFQELRDLTRARKQFVRERGRNVQRIQKVLQDANIKLDSYLTDITGRSGRSMLAAMIAGQKDPRVLAALAHPRAESSRDDLAKALDGRLTAHHRAMLEVYVSQLDAMDAAIDKLERYLEVALAPFREAQKHLMTIPGVSEIVAASILAELGSDMSRFASVSHVISWAGLCPRADESAGKRRSTRIREGAPWLKPVLVAAAWAAARTKSSYERALYFRLKSRRGAGKAVIAVAASILGAAYHVLRDGVVYRDLGAAHFDRLDRDRIKNSLVRRLNRLGYGVDLHAPV
jgi:transposase